QVNLLARNAKLRVLNARVNMYRGFMRLEVDEDDEMKDGPDIIEDTRPSSITVIGDEEEEEEDGVRVASTRGVSSGHPSEDTTTTTAAATIVQGAIPRHEEIISRSERSSGAVEQSSPGTEADETTAMTQSAAATSMTLPTMATSGSPSNSLVSSSAPAASLGRDQLEVEMRLGTGGSVPLMEYYRTIEFMYFSTVEPIGR
ncbi:hypothetical protein BX616_010036, partial [Lobosporangium transversale]